MKQLIKHGVVGVALSVGVLAAPVATAQSVDIYGGCTADSSNAICKSRSNTLNPIIENIINILLMVVAVISVVMIIIGGILFAVSNGDSSKVTRARQTIIYATAGLIVALFSYAIVSFAFDKATGPTTEQEPDVSTTAPDRSFFSGER